MTGAPTTAAELGRSIDPSALLAYVRTRRWFGAKGGAPSAVRVADATPLPWEEGAFALLRVEVTTRTGSQLYQVPLAARSRLASGATAIARAGGLHLYDAVEDPAFRRHVADAFARGCTVDYPGGRWVVERSGSTPLVLPPDAPIELGSAEQSNTSMRLGSAAILKLFRKLEPGEHPDLEITEFLTLERGFAHTPVLLGSMRWEGEGTTTVGGMLQELVPEATDAWAHALATGRPYFTAPRDREPQDAFAADAAQLGRTTRAMHDALASDASRAAFAPERVERRSIEAWAMRARTQVEEAIDLLARQLEAAAIPAARVEEARAVVRRRGQYVALVDEVIEHVGGDAGLCIRHHGDYHLGQVLRTAAGEFMIIDFEGEPARPLEARRRKQSALRDVAGMLRSFSYAAATLAAEARAGRGGVDPATIELRAGRWERDARTAFLDGYFGTNAASHLPRDPRKARRLLSLFEAEKVFYELSYELNNRPDWIGIPLRGIARLTQDGR